MPPSTDSTGGTAARPVRKIPATATGATAAAIRGAARAVPLAAAIGHRAARAAATDGKYGALIA